MPTSRPRDALSPSQSRTNSRHARAQKGARPLAGSLLFRMMSPVALQDEVIFALEELSTGARGSRCRRTIDRFVLITTRRLRHAGLVYIAWSSSTRDRRDLVMSAVAPRQRAVARGGIARWRCASATTDRLRMAIAASQRVRAGPQRRPWRIRLSVVRRSSRAFGGAGLRHVGVIEIACR